MRKLKSQSKDIPNKTKLEDVGSKQEKLEMEIKAHLNKRAAIMASLKETRIMRKTKTEKLDGFKSSRKTNKDSLHTGIDEILQRNGIKRQAYHGGDLVGGHSGILMERAEEIMCDVEVHLIESKKNLVNKDQQIRTQQVMMT